MAISRSFVFLAIAILISPILGVFLSSLVRDIFLFFVMDIDSWVHNIPAFIASGFSRSILGLFVSLPIVLLYGLPIFYLLKKWNQQSVLMYCLFGLLPTLAGHLVLLIRSSQALDSLNTYLLGAGALDGAMTALIFWLFAVHIPSRRMEGS